MIRRMVAEWDPRYFEVWPISAPTEGECDRHFLWRFWQKLPGSQDINVFDRSWYGHVLVDRVDNLCSEAEWPRAYYEINETRKHVGWGKRESLRGVFGGLRRI